MQLRDAALVDAEAFADLPHGELVAVVEFQESSESRRQLADLPPDVAEDRQPLGAFGAIRQCARRCFEVGPFRFGSDSSRVVALPNRIVDSVANLEDQITGESVRSFRLIFLERPDHRQGADRVEILPAFLPVLRQPSIQLIDRDLDEFPPLQYSLIPFNYCHDAFLLVISIVCSCSAGHSW